MFKFCRMTNLKDVDEKTILILCLIAIILILILIIISLILQNFKFNQKTELQFRSGDKIRTITFYGTKDAQLPFRSKELQAAVDLKFHTTRTIERDSIIEIELSIGVKIPEGHFGWITLRSSAHTKKIIVHGGAIIDEYYSGLLKVYLWNLSTKEDYTLERGKSLLQLLFIPCHQGHPILVHPNQISWSKKHLDLGTGSSGNVLEEDKNHEVEEKKALNTDANIEE